MDEEDELDAILAAEEQAMAGDDDSAASDEDEGDDEDDEDAELAADLAGTATDAPAVPSVGAAEAMAEPNEEDAAGDEEGDEDDEEDNEEDDDADKEDGDAAGVEPEVEGAADDQEPAGDGDAPAAKRRGKPKDPKAPKKPLLPYHQHGAAERLRLKESNPDILTDLKATGKAISVTWEAVSQARKDEMQAAYDKLKAVWDVEMGAYKKTESYRQFQKEFNAWKDGRMMKKLLKKQKAVTPARPKSGYMSFAARARVDLQTEMPGADPGAVSKKIAEKWAALSPKEQEDYQAVAKKERAEWLVKMAEFKRTGAYCECVDDQMALELKQGLKRLKDEYADKMPQRPMNTILIWSAATGVKGPMVDVSKQFQVLTEDQQKPWHEKSEQNRNAFKEATEKFAASSDGKRLNRLQAALKKKVAVSGARKKFLVDQPKRVPGVHILCTNADMGAGRAGNWTTLAENDRKFWQVEHSRLVAEYEKDIEAFRQTDSWKKFEHACAAGNCGKGTKDGGSRKAKGDAKAKPKPKMPAAENMPAKPVKAIQFYMQEQKGSGLKVGVLSKRFADLGEEGQKKYREMAENAASAHAAEMAAWAKSKEGKKHARALDAQKQKKKELRAREKFLTGEGAPQEPKKPKSAQVIFVEERRIELQQADASLGVRELSRKVATLWSELDATGRSTYEAKQKSQQDVYEFELQAYKETPAYKKFEKAAGRGKNTARRKGDKGVKSSRGAKRKLTDEERELAKLLGINGDGDADTDMGSSDNDGLDSDDD